MPNFSRKLQYKPEVNFFLRKPIGTEKHGKTTVYAYIKYGSERSNNFSTEMRGYEKDWDNSEKRFRGKVYEFINSELSRIEDDITTLYKELKRLDLPISAKKLHSQYLETMPIATLEYAIKSYFDSQKARFNRNEIREETIKNIRARCERLQKYVVAQKLTNYKVSEIIGFPHQN